MTGISRKSTLTVFIRKMWMVSWLAVTSMILTMSVMFVDIIRWIRLWWFYSDRRGRIYSLFNGHIYHWARRFVWLKNKCKVQRAPKRYLKCNRKSYLDTVQFILHFINLIKIKTMISIFLAFSKLKNMLPSDGSFYKNNLFPFFFDFLWRLIRLNLKS